MLKPQVTVLGCWGLATVGETTCFLIKSDEGKKIIKRNLPLVTLPFDGTKRIIFQPDKVTKKKLIKTFSKYNFRSFLKQENFQHWERIFCND